MRDSLLNVPTLNNPLFHYFLATTDGSLFSSLAVAVCRFWRKMKTKKLIFSLYSPNPQQALGGCGDKDIGKISTPPVFEKYLKVFDGEVVQIDSTDEWGDFSFF